MKEYVTPTITRGNFTKGKHYEIKSDFTNGSRVLIIDDKGEAKIVRVDGELSERLDYASKFHRVSFELNNALNIQAKADALAWRIKNNATIAIKDACIKDGQIYNIVGKRNENEYIKVLEQLREILRVPEGENIVQHAKVVRTLADGLIALQK